MAQKRHQKIGDGMLAKVRRYIPDAQLSIGRARSCIMCIWDYTQQAVIDFCLLSALLCAEIAVVAHKEILAVQFCRLGRLICKTA